MSTPETTDHTPLIDIQGLTIRFVAQTVLRNVNLTVPCGETLAVIGESGCGKTVLMKTIIGLIRPTSGRGAIRWKELGRSQRQTDDPTTHAVWFCFPRRRTIRQHDGRPKHCLPLETASGPSP